LHFWINITFIHIISKGYTKIKYTMEAWQGRQHDQKYIMFY